MMSDGIVLWQYQWLKDLANHNQYARLIHIRDSFSIGQNAVAEYMQKFQRGLTV